MQRWDDALKAYTAKAAQASSPHLVLEATLGQYNLVPSAVTVALFSFSAVVSLWIRIIIMRTF